MNNCIQGPYAHRISTGRFKVFLCTVVKPQTQFDLIKGVRTFGNQKWTVTAVIKKLVT